MDVEAERPRAIERLFRDHVRGPRDVTEEIAVEPAETQEVVAAIRARTEDDALARSGEDARRFEKERHGQGRAVRVQHHCGGVAPIREQHREGVHEAIAEIGKPRFVAVDPRGQGLAEERLAARRSKGHGARDRSLLARGQEVRRPILEECRVETRGLAGGERRTETGFRPSGRGRLGHHRDRAPLECLFSHASSCSTARGLARRAVAD